MSEPGGEPDSKCARPTDEEILSLKEELLGAMKERCVILNDLHAAARPMKADDLAEVEAYLNTRRLQCVLGKKLQEVNARVFPIIETLLAV